jgi:hypothetical protein
VCIQNRKLQNSLRSVGNCFASRSNFLLRCVRIKHLEIGSVARLLGLIYCMVTKQTFVQLGNQHFFLFSGVASLFPTMSVTRDKQLTNFMCNRPFLAHLQLNRKSCRDIFGAQFCRYNSRWHNFGIFPIGCTPRSRKYVLSELN